MGQKPRNGQNTQRERKMPTRRTAAKVTPKDPKTDIAVVVDTATVEAPKTDKAPITLESLKAAHEAAKAAFVELPNKGDIVGLLDAAGELLTTGAVATKPDTGAMMVQITWADMRTTAVYVRKLVKIGDGGWTVQN